MIDEKSAVYLAFRLILGSIFIFHGISKLGEGFTAWNDFMSSKGVPYLIAILAVIIELSIGLLLFLGVYTKIASFIGIIFMLIAIYIAHRNDPLFGSQGIGYQLLIILGCIGLSLTGSGKYAIIAD
jgi:putative oxidoreductase